MRPTVSNVITISLNGSDNVGKTSQMSFIPDTFEIRSGIQNYHPQIEAFFKENTLKDWWFQNSSNEEFIATIMCAVVNRWNTSSTTKEFLIFDRGAIMFEAVCIATIAVKDHCDLKAAEKTYKSIKESLGYQIPTEDIRILLKHGQNLKESVEISLSREHTFDDLYRHYQGLLQQQLEIQESNNVYSNVVNVTNMSIIEVQNEIRSIINKYCASKSKPVTLLRPMFEHVDAIVAFGGLSESGKSCLAEGVCKKFEIAGVKSARLKIGYFMEMLPDIYQLPNNKQAEFLSKQLDRYLQCHYWLKVITLESCHNLRTTQELQKILGKLLQIVYIDVSLDIRKERSCTTIDELVAKDKIKTSRGADRIKSETSCFVLDNNKRITLDESTNTIYEMLKSKYEPLALQALLHNRYSGKVSLFSNQFVLSAGSVLIHKSDKKICLIRHLAGKEEWLLPKGRKDINETLQACALRETYEETGYACSLMPLSMETRATPSGNEHFHDVARKIGGINEPFMISLRKIGGSTLNQKIIFWYVSQVDEDKPRELNTQMENEDFEAKLLSLDEAIKVLSFDEDKLLVQQAYKLFEDTQK